MGLGRGDGDRSSLPLPAVRGVETSEYRNMTGAKTPPRKVFSHAEQRRAGAYVAKIFGGSQAPCLLPAKEESRRAVRPHRSGSPDSRTLLPCDPIFFHHTAILWTRLHGVVDPTDSRP